MLEDNSIGFLVYETLNPEKIAAVGMGRDYFSKVQSVEVTDPMLRASRALYK